MQLLGQLFRYFIFVIGAYLLVFTNHQAIAETQLKINQSAVSNVQNDFHHHIHNFYFSDWDKTDKDYLAMHRHALAMSYDGTTHYIRDMLPDGYNHLNRIMLHNAYYIPAHIDFEQHLIKYSASYMVADNKSALSPEKTVWKSYPIKQSDLEFIKGYACAKTINTDIYSPKSNLFETQRLFHVDKVHKRIVVNWQSKYVVQMLIKHTIETLMLGLYDFLFIDDLPRDVGHCENKAYGGMGSYTTWKDGQLAFLQGVKKGIHSIKGFHQKPIRMFGNLWSPYADSKSAEWYASGALRLDHYYFESAGFAKEDILNGQKSNTKDPETELPAFKPIWGKGYIPANKISLSTNLDTMYRLSKRKYSKAEYSEYLAQHYKAAGTAAIQGAWFGWYGETSVNKRDHSGALIHSNLMQLLRVIPNWDNLANIVLADRSFDGKIIYKSKQSQFNQDFAISKNPINQETYLVFRSLKAQIPFNEELKTAYFVNEYFEKTNHEAINCLKLTEQSLTLMCPNMVGHGIRISVM